MKKNQIIIIAVLLVLSIAAIILTTGNFSLIDESSGPSCKVDNTGGSCELLLKLEAGQKLAEGYSFDLNVKPTYDENFKEPQQLTFFISGGPVSTWNSANNNPVGDNTHNFYLYNTPNSIQNVYQYNITSVSQASISTSSLSTARAYAEIMTGYTRLAYTQSFVEICPYQDDDMCPADTHILNSWIDAQGRKDFNYNNMYFQSSTGGLQVRGSSSSYPRSTSGAISSESIIGNILPIDGKIVVKTNTYSQVSMATSSFSQPVVTMSWKEQYDISNLKVKIGDTQVIMYPGKLNSTDRIYLPSLTSAINEYCGRTGFNPRDDECIFKMTFESTRGGEIVIVSELGELTPVGGGFDFGMFTGWVTFDYETKPLNAGITTGIIALIFGVVIYFIVRKK